MAEPNYLDPETLPDEEISEILQDRELFEKGIIIDHTEKKVFCEHCFKSPNYTLKDILEHVKLHDQMGNQNHFMHWLRGARARQMDIEMGPYFQALFGDRADYDYGQYVNVPYQHPGVYVTFVPVVPMPVVQHVTVCTCCANCDGNCACHYTTTPLVCGSCPSCVNNRANVTTPSVVPQLYPITYTHYPIYPQYADASNGLYNEYRSSSVDEDDTSSISSTDEEDEVSDVPENPENQQEDQQPPAILIDDGGLMFYLSDLMSRISFL